MNLVLAGGGTGGHVYPALALAGALRRRDPDARVLFVGSASGMEASLVPAAGVPFAGLIVRPPRRRALFREAVAVGTGAAALVQSAAIVARFRPDAVVATGGIAAAPPVLAAWLMRVPVVLLEGNAAPGRVNSFLARFARAVAVTSDDASARIPGGRAVVTGLPVRPEIYSTPRSEGVRAFGLDPGRRTVLVIGGSQGAARLNAAVDEMAAQLAGRADLQILHQTGRGWASRFMVVPSGALMTAGSGGPADAGGIRHVPVPYFDEIGLAYGCADLVISRCGATALAEITACGLPAVLVPYRYAAGGHQTENAAPLVRAGAAVLVADEALDGAALARAVLEIFESPGRRDAMAGSSRALGRPDAADRVLALLERVRGGTTAAVSKRVRPIMTASPTDLGGSGVPLGRGARTHFVGIGGAGMSAIARVLLARGCAVSGSDLRESETTRRLRAAGAVVHIGHAAPQIEGAQIVIVSRAVPDDNVEVRAAVARRVPIVHRARMLAELMRGRHAIAVVGTHGKTTTTAMLGAILARAGRDPTVLVGGDVASLGGTARVGDGPDVVAEVDESDGSLLWIKPSVAVVTPLDATDHLDFYGSETRLMDTFRQFLDAVPAGGFAAVCADAPASRVLARAAGPRTVTYGLDSDATYRGRVLETAGRRTVMEARRGEAPLGRVELAIPGAYNAQNALGALAVATELGVPQDVIAAALAAFEGVARRFSVRGDVGGILIVDDYAHNPTKVAALLAAVRRGWPDARIVAVFQPHRFTRTQTVGHQFARAFDPVDELIVTEIYAADEPPIPGVDAGIIVRAVSAHRPVRFVPDLADAAAFLAAEARAGDLILTIGAGDVWKVADDVAARLEGRAAPSRVEARRG